MMTEFNVAFRMYRDLFVVVDNAQRSKLLSHPKKSQSAKALPSEGTRRVFRFGNISPMIKRNRVVSPSCNRSQRRERREPRNLERGVNPGATVKRES